MKACIVLLATLIASFNLNAQKHRVFKCPQANGTFAYGDKPCNHQSKIDYASSADEKIAISNIPITLRLSQVPVATVLALIAETAGKDWLYSPTLNGMITSVHYSDAPVGKVMSDLEFRHGIDVLVEKDSIFAVQRYNITGEDPRKASERESARALDSENYAYNQMIEILEREYPALNPSSHNYDGRLVEEMELLVSG